MKLLLDACVWGGAVATLAAAGHDVIWVGDWSEDPGDADILEHARQHGRVLVTLDKDFGELAVLHVQRHAGIVRLANCSARQQAQVCLQVLDRHAAQLLQGALVTAEPGRIRIRR